MADCPDCGKYVSTRAVKCPHCGAPVQQIWEEEAKKQYRKEAVIATILGIPALIISALMAAFAAPIITAILNYFGIIMPEFIISIAMMFITMTIFGLGVNLLIEWLTNQNW